MGYLNDIMTLAWGRSAGRLRPGNGRSARRALAEGPARFAWMARHGSRGCGDSVLVGRPRGLLEI